MAFVVWPRTASAVEPPRSGRTVTVLKAQEAVDWGLGEAVQAMLARHLRDGAGEFRVSLSPVSAVSYDPGEIARLHAGLESEVLVMPYLEAQRISVFLFDASLPGEFVVASLPLFGGGVARPTNAIIRRALKGSLDEALAAYRKRAFKPLPKTPSDGTSEKEEDYAIRVRRYRDSRRLFGELSAEEDRGPLYIGASIGMSRFGSSGRSSSTVALGAYAGSNVWDRLQAEVGVRVFTFALGEIDLRYRLPLAEKYVTLALGLGMAKVLALVAETDGFDQTSFYTTGILAGPGLSLEIPLLGAQLRGSCKWYIGDGKSVILGSYGVSYTL